jgi:hypothetical protein
MLPRERLRPPPSALRTFASAIPRRAASREAADPSTASRMLVNIGGARRYCCVRADHRRSAPSLIDSSQRRKVRSRLAQIRPDKRHRARRCPSQLLEHQRHDVEDPRWSSAGRAGKLHERRPLRLQPLESGRQVPRTLPPTAPSSPRRQQMRVVPAYRRAQPPHRSRRRFKPRWSPPSVERGVPQG